MLDRPRPGLEIVADNDRTTATHKFGPQAPEAFPRSRQESRGSRQAARQARETQTPFGSQYSMRFGNERAPISGAEEVEHIGGDEAIKLSIIGRNRYRAVADQDLDPRSPAPQALARECRHARAHVDSEVAAGLR